MNVARSSFIWFLLGVVFYLSTPKEWYHTCSQHNGYFEIQKNHPNSSVEVKPGTCSICDLSQQCYFPFIQPTPVFQEYTAFIFNYSIYSEQLVAIEPITSYLRGPPIL